MKNEKHILALWLVMMFSACDSIVVPSTITIENDNTKENITVPQDINSSKEPKQDSNIDLSKKKILDLEHFLAKGYTLEKEDKGNSTNIKELKKIWGDFDCVDNTRVKVHRSGGDNSLDPFGVVQGNNGYFETVVFDGDDYYGERCELGENEWRKITDENSDWLKKRAFTLYKEGDHKVTFISMRLDKKFPIGADGESGSKHEWQSVMQMKQTQPSNNDSSPILSLHVEAGQWKLMFAEKGYTNKTPLWSGDAKKELWTRFAFDIVYSSRTDRGSIKVYADLNGDGDASDEGEQSKVIKISTLKKEIEGDNDDFKVGEAIPSHLRIGPYHNPNIDCGDSGCSVDFDNIQIIVLDN